MGQIASIPVVSQVKSLVQDIGGDAEGAHKTQETFSQTAHVGSHVNFFVDVIKGDDEDAVRIQEDFLKYQIAMAPSGTQTTVTAVAGAARVLCGPAAPTCAAGLTLAASIGWDTVQGGIREDKVGLVKAWDNPISGQSTEGVGMATIRAKAGGQKNPKSTNPKSKEDKSLKLRGRKRMDNDDQNSFIFDQSLPDIPETLVPRLPSSVGQLSFTDTMEASSIIDNVLSVFLVLRLMGIGHIKSKPYYNEICKGVYPSMELEECTRMMFGSLVKYSDNTPAADSDFQPESNHNQFTNLLDTVKFELMSLSKNTILGHILEVAACDILGSDAQCLVLEKKLRKRISKVDQFTNKLITKRRVKRSWFQQHGSRNTFIKKHLLTNTDTLYHKWIRSKKNKQFSILHRPWIEMSMDRLSETNHKGKQKIKVNSGFYPSALDQAKHVAYFPFENNQQSLSEIQDVPVVSMTMHTHKNGTKRFFAHFLPNENVEVVRNQHNELVHLNSKHKPKGSEKSIEVFRRNPVHWMGEMKWGSEW